MFEPVQKAFDAITHRPLAKLGGDAYLLGNATLAITGGIGSSWNQVAGAVAFFATGAMYSQRGDKDGWFAAACIICIPAMTVTNLHGIAAGEAATIIGTGVYAAGQLFGAFSKPLTQQFREAGNNLVRRTLGTPRKWMGALCLGSKVLMIYDAVKNHNWGFLTVLGFWSAGDIGVGLSTARASRQATPATQLSL